MTSPPSKHGSLSNLTASVGRVPVIVSQFVAVSAMPERAPWQDRATQPRRSFGARLSPLTASICGGKTARLTRNCFALRLLAGEAAITEERGTSMSKTLRTAAALAAAVGLAAVFSSPAA